MAPPRVLVCVCVCACAEFRAPAILFLLRSQISEATLMKGPEHARPLFEALMRDTKGLRDKQHALMLARHDLM